MSTSAKGGIEEAGWEADGVGKGGGEHLRTAQIVHHDAGQVLRHLRQQGGQGSRRAAALSSLHAQCLIEASRAHKTSRDERYHASTAY